MAKLRKIFEDFSKNWNTFIEKYNWLNNVKPLPVFYSQKTGNIVVSTQTTNFINPLYTPYMTQMEVRTIYMR
jgi:hypothetical protein